VEITGEWRNRQKADPSTDSDPDSDHLLEKLLQSQAVQSGTMVSGLTRRNMRIRAEEYLSRIPKLNTFWSLRGKCSQLRNRVLAFCMAAFFLCFAPSASAWGPMGHRVAARMAETRLSPKALAAIQRLLGPDVHLADIATWADEQKEIPDAAQWHYVNVPLTAPQYEARYCPPQGCVVSRIEYFRRVLLEPGTGRQEKQRALKFLVHLVADLHQPLHVGDNNDKGGNLLQVQFFSIGSNLHRVWDSQIMERHTNNEQVWAWDLDGVTNPAKAGEWSKGTPEQWATQSLEIAKTAYRVAGSAALIQPGAKIGNEYCRTMLPVIQKQLAKAGVRTAFILNQIFG
jgi:nuclease S1